MALRSGTRFEKQRNGETARGALARRKGRIAVNTVIYPCFEKKKTHAAEFYTLLLRVSFWWTLI